MVLLLVGAAMSFKTVISLSQTPQMMADWILTLTADPLILLLMINLFLFVVGMFLDAGPAIIILAPILGPSSPAWASTACISRSSCAST